MIQKNSGFTLIELMAVVAILAVVILVASASISSVMKNAKNKASEEMRNNLKDIAVTSILGNVHLSKCSEKLSLEIEDGNIVNLEDDEKCVARVTVKSLKDNGLFEDEKGYCSDNEEVIVYRYSVNENTEYKAYINNNACTNY